MNVLAHAGGWDELLLAAAAITLLVMLRPRRRGGAAVAEGPCLYCGRHLRAGTDRCPGCGFRPPRAPATLSPTDAAR
jgi:hypothetical protein